MKAYGRPDDRALIERIRKAWGRPELSASEKAAFDEQLVRRLRKQPGRNLLRLALTGGAAAAAVVIAMFVVTQGGNDRIESADEAVGLATVQQGSAEEEPARISSWMESLTSPEPQDRFVGRLAPEYQAIAAWLALDTEQVR